MNTHTRSVGLSLSSLRGQGWSRGMGWWGSGAQNQPWVEPRSRRDADRVEAVAARARRRRRRRRLGVDEGARPRGADDGAGLEDAAGRGGGLGGGVARGVLQLEVEARALALELVAHAAQLLGALLGGDGDGGGGARRRGAGVERLALAAELGERRLGVAVGRGEAAPDELDRRVPLGAVEVRREVLVRRVGGVLLVDERRDARILPQDVLRSLRRTGGESADRPSRRRRRRGGQRRLERRAPDGADLPRLAINAGGRHARLTERIDTDEGEHPAAKDARREYARPLPRAGRAGGRDDFAERRRLGN